MFGITSAFRFFEKARADYARLEADIADPDAAMNCILSLYHLHEWVWARWLKTRPAMQETLGIGKDIGTFVAWLDGNCPYFALLQELARGVKHCSPVSSTDQVKGFGRGPFGIGPFGRPYLLIDLGDHLPPDKRYLVASAVLRDVTGFWTDFFDKHGITDDADPSPSG